jgi:uncharacterized membrane protein
MFGDNMVNITVTDMNSTMIDYLGPVCIPSYSILPKFAIIFFILAGVAYFVSRISKDKRKKKALRWAKYLVVVGVIFLVLAMLAPLLSSIPAIRDLFGGCKY